MTEAEAAEQLTLSIAKGNISRRMIRLESGNVNVEKEDVLKAVAKELEVDEEQVEVAKYGLTAGCAPGDNGTSEVRSLHVSAAVNGCKHAINRPLMQYTAYLYFAKYMPPRKSIYKTVFNNEVLMYSTLLPRLQEMEPRLSLPKCFHSREGLDGVIILEELNSQKFAIADKRQGLNIKEMEIVLEQLAYLHSTSFHLIRTHPSGQDGFKKEFPSLHSDCWFNVETDQMRAMVEAMFDMNDKILKEFLLEFEPSLVPKATGSSGVARRDKVKECLNKKGAFNCLIHNDAWCNNFMFKRVKITGSDESRLLVKVLDWQLSRVGRPALDLVYLMGSSTNLKFRKQHLSHFLKFYHQKLVQKLTDLGYDEAEGYSLENLLEDYQDCRFFGYHMAVFHTMIQLTPKQPPKPDQDTPVKEVGDENSRFCGFKSRVLDYARNNDGMRERLLDIVREAVEDNVI